MHQSYDPLYIDPAAIAGRRPRGVLHLAPAPIAIDDVPDLSLRVLAALICGLGLVGLVVGSVLVWCSRGI